MGSGPIFTLQEDVEMRPAETEAGMVQLKVRGKPEPPLYKRQISGYLSKWAMRFLVLDPFCTFSVHFGPNV